MSKAQLYAYVQQYSKEAVDVLLDIMRSSHNEGLKMGAAKGLLDKCIPDLRATEITGEEGGAVLVRLITEADAKSNIITSGGSTDTELPSPTNDL